MGLIGKYLALLDEVERDRVIEAQQWGTGEYGSGDGPRCLVGHAEQARMDSSSLKSSRLRFPAKRLAYPEDAFDAACERFGLLRIVRAVKLRAACPDRAERIARARASSSDSALHQVSAAVLGG